jgi:RNA polymerase sigma-70 factor (ECF subfamily)
MARDETSAPAEAKKGPGRPVPEAHEGALSALMMAYQAGDGSAFEALYCQLAPQIGGYLRSLCRDAARAEDLLQETFLQVHRSRRTYLPPRPVKPWIYAIARNVFLMSRRAGARRERREAAVGDALPDIAVPPEVASLADRETVRDALAQVPEERREPLLLHHVWGLSFREIGAVLGVSEAAAKLRAHRGVRLLRELLAGGER